MLLDVADAVDHKSSGAQLQGTLLTFLLHHSSQVLFQLWLVYPYSLPFYYPVEMSSLQGLFVGFNSLLCCTGHICCTDLNKPLESSSPG